MSNVHFLEKSRPPEADLEVVLCCLQTAGTVNGCWRDCQEKARPPEGHAASPASPSELLSVQLHWAQSLTIIRDTATIVCVTCQHERLPVWLCLTLLSPERQRLHPPCGNNQLKCKSLVRLIIRTHIVTPPITPFESFILHFDQLTCNWSYSPNMEPRTVKIPSHLRDHLIQNPHFPDGESKSQRGEVTCPRLYS